MSKEKILGFDVCTYNEKELLENIFMDYKNNEQLFIVNINPEIVMSNYKNIELQEIFNNQKYQISDGTGIVWASKKNNGNIKERITGIDLMTKICELSQNYSSKIYLYGAQEEVVKNTEKELKKMFPKINIVGFCNGYCDEDIAFEDIKNKKPDILFVGLGSPKQEKFIIKYKEYLSSVKILMPVGGSFDVISKTKKRAPNWIIKCNIEWLYRLIKEPTRIKRQLKLIKYMFLVIKEKHTNKNLYKH